MEIRSVTLLAEPDFDQTKAKRFFAASAEAFTVPVQTVRVALPPFPDWWPQDQPLDATARAVADRWQAAGASYISVGPVQLHHDADWLTRIPALLSATDVLFCSAAIADTNGNIDVARSHATAEIVRQVSQILPNGFGNLYLTAIANCPPGSPFFPVAYHAGGEPGFALAVEAADLARTAIQSAESLSDARQNLIAAIETTATELTISAERLAATTGIPFQGIDFSLAPFPTEAQSLGGALEDVGVTVGQAGALFAAGFITEAIGRADFMRCGFSGLMLPVLEDAVLARRAAEGVVDLNALLAYSAVCGVGLDTIPLSGDISAANLAGILLDVAALATRLNKPLTARLMPLPGLQAGDAAAFDFPYFADSRVMAVPGEGAQGLLADAAALRMRPYATKS